MAFALNDEESQRPHYQDLENQTEEGELFGEEGEGEGEREGEREERVDDYGPSIYEMQSQTLDEKWPFAPSTIVILEEEGIDYIIPDFSIAALACFVGIVGVFAGLAILLVLLLDLTIASNMAIRSFLPIFGGIIAPIICSVVWGNNPLIDYGMIPTKKNMMWGVMLGVTLACAQFTRITFSYSETSAKWHKAWEEDPEQMFEFRVIWLFSSLLYPLSYNLSTTGFLFTFLTLNHTPRYLLFFILFLVCVSCYVTEWEWGVLGGILWVIEGVLMVWTRFKTGGIVAGSMGLLCSSLSLYFMCLFFMWAGDKW